MKKIVLLCGVGAVGKTKTLKKFFGENLDKKLRPLQLLQRTINGTIIYAVSLASPQEMSDFCDVENVRAIIRNKIEKCDFASGGKHYTLVIPFGLFGAQSGNLNEKCIYKPIEWLQNLGFRVNIIYLRKKTARRLVLIDSFMRTLTSNVIESTEEYERQAREFESFIERF